jgi:hypothetical protein
MRELIERLGKLAKEIEGGGISWQMGEPRICRYDSVTGEPYYVSRPAELTTSSRKLRAIIDLYEGLPEIITLLRSLDEAGRAPFPKNSGEQG